jgi:hypothetical protein
MNSDSQMAAFLAEGSISLIFLIVAAGLYFAVQAAKAIQETTWDDKPSLLVWGCLIAFLIFLYFAYEAGGQDWLLNIATVLSLLGAIGLAFFTRTSQDPYFQRPLDREDLAHRIASEPWWDSEEAEEIA